jgi:hypothetical protein
MELLVEKLPIDEEPGRWFQSSMQFSGAGIGKEALVRRPPAEGNVIE